MEDSTHRDQDGELWRAFVASAPDSVLVLDPDGSIRYVNRVSEAFKHLDIIGRKVWEFATGPDPEARLRALLRRLVEERKPHSFEHEGWRRDGTLGWLEVICIPVVVESGVHRILWWARDVTERHIAQERVEASERRFRAVIEQGAEAIVMFDADARISYASPGAERTLGYTQAEMIGKSAADFVHPDDRAAAFQAGRGGAPGVINARTLRIKHKDGTWRVHEGTSTNLVNDPAVRAVVSTSRDVTEERERHERLAFQAAVLAQINEPVLASTVGSVITYWNAAAEKLLGWTAEEIVGRHAHAFLHPHYPRGLEDIKHHMLTFGEWRGEIVMRKKNGEDVTVEASTRNMPGTSDIVISVFKDITAQRALEEQLRQSQKMEAIGLLAGGVAHDFNNLLAVIVGFSELAARKLPQGHPVAAQLAEVFDAARRGGELTKKLLAFSRKQIIQPRVLDAAAAVDDFSRLLSRILGEDVELAIDRPEQEILLRADPVQLEQVLLNLCTNARQAMPDGGMLRLASRFVTFDEGGVRRQPWARVGTWVEIAVTDTGVGMDARTMQHVFEPFFTTKPEGTGLGLATVHGIVQQHGGFVHVESAPGDGTTFRVYFPRAEDVVASSSQRSGPGPTEGPPRASP
ncbi:MAG TPA: PAS domain S-box protein [Polyangiaceae bacterium]